MNNKIVAVVLSVVAVVVVVYQIFLRKDEDDTKKVRTAQFVNTNAPVRNVPPPSVSNSNTTEEDLDGSGDINNNTNRMIIDLYSPELLKRVKPYIDKSMIEITGEFGDNIFGFKKKKEIDTPEALKETKMPVLTLNGIIEIIKDKITVAIINNRIYRKGETVENAVVTEIRKYKVFLKFNKETIILTVHQDSYKGWIERKTGGKS